MSWLLTADDSIEWTIEIYKKAWVGIGWHALSASETGMKNSDFIVAYFTNGTCTVMDAMADPSAESQHGVVFDTDVGGTPLFNIKLHLIESVAIARNNGVVFFQFFSSDL